MKLQMNKKFGALLPLFLLIGGIFLSGCLGEKSDNEFVELIKLAPDGERGYVYYFNVNNVPHDLKEELGKAERNLNAWGIDFSKVNHLAAINGEWIGESLILNGDFDQNNLIKNFKDKGFSSRSLNNKEVWVNGDTYISFLDKRILIGRGEDGVKTLLNQPTKNSLYDNQDVQRVLDEVPSGFLMFVLKDEKKGIMGYSLRKGTNYEATYVIKADEYNRNKVKSDFEREKSGKKIVNKDFTTIGDLLIITATSESAEDLMLRLR